jgi:RNA recognition motif-containing protein
MTKLFVGNLSWSTTDDSLRAFFEQVGQVESARVVMDKMTGRSRGFGFVEMPNAEDAAKAVADLNEKDLDGRNIRVNEALPEGERPARREFSGGGNRGGFNRGGDRGGDRGGSWSR